MTRARYVEVHVVQPYTHDAHKTAQKNADQKLPVQKTVAIFDTLEIEGRADGNEPHKHVCQYNQPKNQNHLQAKTSRLYYKKYLKNTLGGGLLKAKVSMHLAQSGFQR